MIEGISGDSTAPNMQGPENAFGRVDRPGMRYQTSGGSKTVISGSPDVPVCDPRNARFCLAAWR